MHFELKQRSACVPFSEKDV